MKKSELKQIIKEEIEKSSSYTANLIYNKFNGDLEKIDKFIDKKLLTNINKLNTPVDKVDEVDKFWKEVYRLIFKK